MPPLSSCKNLKHIDCHIKSIWSSRNIAWTFWMAINKARGVLIMWIDPPRQAN
ncbi:hypothetical protein Csa_003508, partial [Cucumis sativus]